MNIRIKICGITHPDDAELAADAGADMIGVNFVEGSPRYVEPRVAEEIVARVAGRVECIGVFRNAEPEDIERVLRRVDLDRLQFHGEETEEEVESVDLPVIKAVRGASPEAAEEFPGTILLLDHPGGGGGRGEEWDWSTASELIESGHDVILAGGLDPENVTRALEGLGEMLPWGVDVATGVEGEGVRKDADKIKRFVAAVRASEIELELEA